MGRYQWISLILILGLSLSACNQKKIEELERQNQALTEQNQLQDSILTEFMDSFNEFEQNLQMIKERENLISLNASDPEMAGDQKTKINQDLRDIGELLEKNRGIIDELNQKVESNNVRSNKLRRSIARLTKQMEEKDQEIASLLEDLKAKNLQIEDLEGVNSSLMATRDTLSYRASRQAETIATQTERLAAQDQTLQEQTTRLNTGFYLAGSKKALKQNKVLINSKQLNPNLDQRTFQQIDITEVNVIPVEAKKVKLMTAHPSGSYKLISESKNISGIEITDPESFWKNSKYLVVMTD